MEIMKEVCNMKISSGWWLGEQDLMEAMIESIR
jgi:hypothetical protein